MRKTLLLSLLVPVLLGIFGFFPVENKKKNFHSDHEREYLKSMLKAPRVPDWKVHVLEIDSNILFPTGKVCGGCHGKDSVGHALVTTSGVDVNIYDDWRSTMMANSAKDPFWRAKVTHEIMANPEHSTALQDKCTTCHAPSGNYQAKLHDNKPHYLLSDLYADTLGLDGVSCQTCHAQAPGNLGALNSGAINFDTTKIRMAYGPYEFIFIPPMRQFVGITPQYGEHIHDAGICAGCHTLLTASVDLEGHPTGSTFVEQATYHEWLNSRYDQQHDNITCQGCHIPRLQDEIIIAANYQFLTPKYPFGVHELVGANTMMLKLLRNNIDTLGIRALPQHFDSTIAATMRMLQQKTLDLSVSTTSITSDSATFAVRLQNKAGHKFPSGYPSRRAWIELEVVTADGSSLFHSGRMNPDFTLADEDPHYEPHYQKIVQPDQVQIYELVPGDVTGNFTTLLERAHVAMKDNRLTPRGFSLADAAYDTTRIVGVANDPDFNHHEGIEGSGDDVVYYRIPTKGYTGTLQVRARVWYQSVPPKWVLPMFSFHSPEIDFFHSLYDTADKSPVLVAEKTLDGIFVSPSPTVDLKQQWSVKLWPNPTPDGKVYLDVKNAAIKDIKAWNAAGKLVFQSGAAREILLNGEPGIYYIEIQTSRGRVVRKVVR